MSGIRSYHTATLLPDGQVLVTGGGQASAEIYDPARGTWSPTTSMSTARSGHTATLLQDGRVLVSGGSVSWGPPDSITTSTSAEIYDPALGTWSQTGSMTTEREMHTAILLLDGQVLVSGGYFYSYTTSLAAMYGYAQLGKRRDLRSGFGNLVGDRLDARGDPLRPHGHAAIRRPGARQRRLQSLLLSFNDYLASAEIYNPAHGTWSPTAVMSTPRYGHTATLLPDGRVLVSGGGFAGVNPILASAEIYSPGAPAPDDATPPQVSCAAADGAWHNSDVTIACTASDLESGLANAADASFNLTTNVPAGTETASAATNSRQVCDVEGNCSTAAPITGNKVDKKAPTIAIALPMAGATYGPNAKVRASYACSDGGSGMTSCTGPVANGSLVNTSSKGTKTFAVTAVDTVGNSATVSVTYSVVAGRKIDETSATPDRITATP